MIQFMKNVFQEKCPKCNQGLTFKKTQSIFKIPEMHENCSNCGYHFEREPGYFIGALYISYALAVFQGLIAFLIMYTVFPGLNVVWILTGIFAVIVLFAKKNYKWSRILYIYIFPW